MQPRGPQPDSDVLALLEDMIGRLHAAGLTAAEEKARRAAELARTDPAVAAEMLAEAAALVRLGVHGR